MLSKTSLCAQKSTWHDHNLVQLLKLLQHPSASDMLQSFPQYMSLSFSPSAQCIMKPGLPSVDDKEEGVSGLTAGVKSLFNDLTGST